MPLALIAKELDSISLSPPEAFLFSPDSLLSLDLVGHFLLLAEAFPFCYSLPYFL